MISPNAIIRTILVSSIILLFSFSSFSQNKGVGIGTKNPQATLHVKGISYPGGSGVRTLLDENFDSYIVEQIGSSVGNCYSTGWVLRNDPPGSYTCIPCAGMMLYINSNSPSPRNCTQDNTAIVRFASTPTTTTVNIYFDAKLQVYTSADRLYVYLYNETTSTQVLLDTYSGSDQTPVERSYSGTQTVVAGHSYSIRFRYAATDGWGVTADNVLVTENVASAPASRVFRLQDGSQKAGNVLVAGDAKGNAYWKNPASLRPISGLGTISENSPRESDENQEENILRLQAIINEQEAIFEAQSKKIKSLEEKMETLEKKR